LTIRTGGWAERVAIVLGVLFVAILAILEFTMYRPQRQRLKTAEQELASVQDQLAGLARRNLADQELYLYASTGPEGEEFRRMYSSQSGLMYLTRLIEGSGLERLDFQSRNVRMDGPFRVENFALVLRGSFARCVAFLKTLEGNPRLARVDFMKMEPGGDVLVVNLRVAVYGLPETR
jgi:hypothetical protein